MTDSPAAPGTMIPTVAIVVLKIDIDVEPIRTLRSRVTA